MINKILTILQTILQQLVNSLYSLFVIRCIHKNININAIHLIGNNKANFDLILISPNNINNTIIIR